MAPKPILELREVDAGYGRAALVLRKLSITVQPGEVHCLVGPNGAGKSTVLRVATGLLTPRSGHVMLKGEDVTGLQPNRLLKKGLAHVLQGHSVFPEMTVGENIVLGGYSIDDKQVLRDRVVSVKHLFPIVEERWNVSAGLLSGGQQKMVEFARAMMLDPDVLLLDEPSMGLEPRAMATVFEQIATLREAGKAVLLVEQNARSALMSADRASVLDLGKVHIEGKADDLLNDPRMGALYLGQRPKSENG